MAGKAKKKTAGKGKAAPKKAKAKALAKVVAKAKTKGGAKGKVKAKAAPKKPVKAAAKKPAPQAKAAPKAKPPAKAAAKKAKAKALAKVVAKAKTKGGAKGKVKAKAAPKKPVKAAAAKKPAVQAKAKAPAKAAPKKPAGKSDSGLLQTEILEMARTVYGNRSDAELLAFDPNTIDEMDPATFYEMVAEKYGVEGDPSNQNFAGFGGTLKSLIAFVGSRWDGKTRKDGPMPPREWLDEFVHPATERVPEQAEPQDEPLLD